MTYEPRTCTKCGGSGGYPETTTMPDGCQITVFRTCQSCGGSGRV